MSVYVITQKYSFISSGFFGIDTDLSISDVNIRCAYLQCIRERLPLLPNVDDVLDEKSCVMLLNDFYGVREIVSPQQPDECIDLHQNWIDYCLYSDDFQSAFKRISVRNASISVLKLMLKRMQYEIYKFKKTDLKKCRHALLELERLAKVIQGECILPEWEWFDINEVSLEGRRFLLQPEPELIPLRGDHLNQPEMMYLSIYRRIKPDCR